MPLYSYEPEQYDELRSDHDDYQAYENPDEDERAPFPEDEYTLDAEGNHTRYEPAAATFTPDSLPDDARTTYDVLIALGATAAVGSYDGGSDELFDRIDGLTVGDAEWDREQALDRLAKTPLGDNPAGPDSRWAHIRAYFDSRPRRECAGYALDALAGAFTGLLEVYGEGDFSVCGAFRVDFVAGTVVDVPQPL